MTQLAYETMVHEGLPRQREQRLPDGSANVSSPVTSALIYGAHDAVLADPPFTRDQVRRFGDWIERSGKTLTRIYATHGARRPLVRHRRTVAMVPDRRRLRDQWHDREDA